MAAHAAANLDRVIALVASVAPAYRPKVIEAVASVYNNWNQAQAPATAFPHALDLLGRLSQAPFALHANAIRALVAMVGHADPDTQLRLAAAPDRVFLRLEKASRRRNDAYLITDGLETICASQCALAVEWLLHETGLLLKVMHLLGGLGTELRDQVITSFSLTSLTSGDASADLDRLRTETLAVLAQGIPVSDTLPPAVRHALQVRRQLYANRVAFRKFLRAHLRGDTSYIPRHPLNQQWLRRHARADNSVWARGRDLAVTLPGTGPVRLSIERDPLEVLRLGTYVGSCLGNGGAFVDSAAAVVLDVNKLVVYARNGRGAVIARQLVAFSEDDTLVCFHVYPLASGSAVKAAFAEFDRLLAAALGIPIQGDGEYEIANLGSTIGGTTALAAPRADRIDIRGFRRPSTDQRHEADRPITRGEYGASPLRTDDRPRESGLRFQLRAFSASPIPRLTTLLYLPFEERRQSGRSRDPQCSFRVCVLGVVSSVAAPAAEWAPSALPWSNHVCGFCGE